MTSLFQELKRRNVFRVAVAYAVVSWLLLQVGDVLFSALKLDDSALSLLVGFLVIGFIPVVIFAWVYELTPEGIKRETEVAEDHSITQYTGKKLNIITLASVVILIGLLVWQALQQWESELTKKTTETQATSQKDARPSIAVLPFQDMSVNGDQEYFGDGISEELLNVLAKTNGLRVAARTSSFKFKGTVADIPEIGKTLNVATVLEGSIRKDGDNIRVTAQLINVADGYHIWSDSYDRKLDNIFQVQDEIALAIVDNLKLTLDLPDSRRDSISAEAYDLYLRGREAARTIDKPNQLKAVEFFERAVAIEPEFAEAYAGLASSWIWLEDYGGFSANYVYPIIARNARKALRINSSNPEALLAMGMYLYNVEDDLVLGKTFIEYAMKENPSLIAIYNHYAEILNSFGDLEGGLKYRKEAVILDPLAIFYRKGYAQQLIYMRDFDEAMRQIEIIFDQNPEDTHGLETRGNYHTTMGDIKEAILDYSKVHYARPGDPYSAASIAMYYQILGLDAQANYWIKESYKRGENNRWELRARATVGILRNDWEGLIEVAEIYSRSDPDTGNTLLGFAKLQQQEYGVARQVFESVLDEINYQKGSVVHTSNMLAILGLVLLDDIEDKPQQYLDDLKRIVDNTIEGEGYYARPDLSAHMIQACLTMMNKRLNLIEKSQQASQIINTAVDDFGFRESSWLNSLHCFEPLSDSEEFQRVVDRIERLNAQQRQQLLELQLEAE